MGFMNYRRRDVVFGIAVVALGKIKRLTDRFRRRDRPRGGWTGTWF